MLKCSLQTVQTVFIFLYFIMTVLVVVAVEVNVFFTTLVELIFRDNLSAMMTSIKVMKYIDNNTTNISPSQEYSQSDNQTTK